MKILIVDDHPILREGLAALLRQLGPDTCVMQARNAGEAFAVLETQPDLDVAILDLNLPGISGMQAISDFGRKRPELPIIVLSSSEDVRDVRKAFHLGVLGYVPKSASHHVLLSAIRLVLDGEIYVPPLLIDALANSPDGQGDAAVANAFGLTERQIEILSLVSLGQPNKTIARSLGLAEKTVKVHVTAIFKALNVVNRTQAAAAARTFNLI